MNIHDALVYIAKMIYRYNNCKIFHFYTHTHTITQTNASQNSSYNFHNSQNHLFEYEWVCHADAQYGFRNLFFLQMVKYDIYPFK